MATDWPFVLVWWKVLSGSLQISDTYHTFGNIRLHLRWCLARSTHIAVSSLQEFDHPNGPRALLRVPQLELSLTLPWIHIGVVAWRIRVYTGGHLGTFLSNFCRAFGFSKSLPLSRYSLIGVIHDSCSWDKFMIHSMSISSILDVDRTSIGTDPNIWASLLLKYFARESAFMFSSRGIWHII